jgi:predicted lipoprotein with Yx(FWY)xxD motif
MHLSLPLRLILLAAALALAGGLYAVAHARPAAAASKHAVVKTRSTSLGTILVDGQGRTLYRFLKDKGRRSQCFGACASNWPPLITSGRPHASGRAKASRLSTIRRTGGARQVDYAGHPLYRFALDSGPGKTSGQGLEAFGGRWYVVAASGRVITSSSMGGY